MQTISIGGIPVELVLIEREELKGLSLDLLLDFRFYKAKFNQHDLCVAKSTDTARAYTPRQYRRISTLVEQILNMPIAFCLSFAPSYMRSRLIEQGVYFILSEQYVFLPGLLINERIKQKDNNEQLLSPVGQYILIYYLLHKEIIQFTIGAIEQCIPYNYLAISRAISELENKELFHTQKEWKTKLVSSAMSREKLWESAKPYLSSPVKRIIYTDRIGDDCFYKGGISALSHYSFLNPDEQQTFVVWEKDFKPDKDVYPEWGASDSNYKIEIWKYAPQMGLCQEEYVDKLSLYLSLQNEKDPRVEKELEILIDKIWQSKE